MLDAPIIARYKEIAGERGYQTLINDTLRHALEGEHFVQGMRNAIREELADYAIVKNRGKSQTLYSAVAILTECARCQVRIENPDPAWLI